MEQKELGDTGIRVPEIGLGTWEYAGGAEPLRVGVQHGATLIDTAERYGTEEIVGAAIREIRDQVFLATKVAPENVRRADLLQAADRSLRRLGTDYIDLYQLHWPNPAVPIEETMCALEELVDSGKVRFIGVCNYSVEQLKRAREVLNKTTIASNQVPYSLINRGIERGLLRYCQQNHITVIAYSPLGRGLHSIRKRDPSRALSRVAGDTGKKEAQVALNWCISKHAVIAIPKADSIQHTIENCNASGWSLSPTQIRHLERRILSMGPIERALRRSLRRVRTLVR